jgi:serine/threonine protein kinase
VKQEFFSQDKPSFVPGGPVIVMEIASGGELFDFVQNCSGLSETLARTYFHQLIASIEGCHQSGVVHRDIKLENLLMDDVFALKLADFGEAEILPKPEEQKEQLIQGRKGTLIYMAPEVLANLKYNQQCDIFSAGVVLFIMLSGSKLFHGVLDIL